MALPLYVPFGYFTFLTGLLWLFSRHYRSRALRRKPPPPWFPQPHIARDIYVSLLSLDPPPSQPVLVAALMARAMADVKRIMSLKEAKQALTELHQKGQVGDDLWERLLLAEREMDLEVSEVVAEANEYAQDWGSVIFPIASEAYQTSLCQEIYKNIPNLRAQKTAQHSVPRPFVTNPGALRILGSRPAVPAAKPKPPSSSVQQPPSQAKQAMLETIKAAQAKLQSEEMKQQASKQSHQSVKSKQNDSDNDLENKSSPLSAKKKKPKKKKKN
ncbi:hypothetical protein O181_066528 [Austropuccinia psidii MF-1]|uniref:Translocation protein SEC66 n=1 Tax=Austropuccinia psidii MF-1 TaxID=1389203 RepID=A0A9Q3EX99_9BASI|nr:hypothetical protein [Austropuccinia psidii MF-1]